MIRWLTGSTLLGACTSPAPTTPAAAPRLVIPDAEGLSWRDPESTALSLEVLWDDLLGPCDQCLGQGASADGDGLLVSFAGADGVARLDGSGALDWRVDGFDFPHDVVRDPTDGSVMVIETFADRVAWIAPEGTDPTPLRTLDLSHPEFVAAPNGAELLQDGDRTYLLLSHLGRRELADETPGRITLWALSSGAPRHVWSFPENGSLAAPHGPVMHRRDGEWWLLWAHTLGGPATGTLGIARTPGLEHVPRDARDLLPPSELAPFAFLRSVSVRADGGLWIVDSGSGVAAGRLLAAPWPTVPKAPFGSLDQVEVLLSELPSPFEAWSWTP